MYEVIYHLDVRTNITSIVLVKTATKMSKLLNYLRIRRRIGPEHVMPIYKELSYNT